jgi:glycosyltransferase involved in cell wall biosynthesis
LAAGKPVACNFSGFQSELSVDRGIGIILQPDNPMLAAQQLYDKLNDQEWCTTAAKRARELACNEFNRDHLAAQLESLLRSVVSKDCV